MYHMFAPGDKAHYNCVDWDVHGTVIKRDGAMVHLLATHEFENDVMTPLEKQDVHVVSGADLELCKHPEAH